eukprot:CAMPEP_0177782728 /NCGR_PEP_ID=MMETSP0491_2-20121128/18674_1 /TAXON_ID=63592 /ORGANISM="Tetraselmis chuii, Strain PLY429" /LENGTH=33 /DNA_ID= /DNA_START= /DNA_END= /DNA_ORIENTATION=
MSSSVVAARRMPLLPAKAAPLSSPTTLSEVMGP